MAEQPDLDGHVMHVCLGDHEDGGWSCGFCAGGLSACDECDAFEGAWPDQCPGERMTGGQAERVYRGELNYRDGAWWRECCQVMRPIHDREAFLAEHREASS